MKILSKHFIKEFWKVVVATFMGFINDNGLKLSASLAYYTVFSIAPLIILVISITSLVLRNYDYNDAIYAQMAHFMGKNAVVQLQEIIKNLELSGKSGIALISGIIILLLGASSMFVEIQDSLNIIWRVKAKPKKGWLKLLQNRFLSFSLIVSLGFLFLVSLVINIIMNALGNQISHFLPYITGILIEVANLAITLIIISVLFG